ncbi:hypothetical protein [Aureivirga sp. CE67]|uniref:hypothetical protein n=1 Tax=Aureivirga sp. CE67 TaxID=1788983 RepID=UPI0018CBDC67|nr:hypothetical protein [Aureivirga sp. CE67]
MLYLSFLLSKESLSIIAVLVLILGNYGYIYGIIKKQIKPHIFTWIIWTIQTYIAAGGQWKGGAYWGAVPTLMNATLCLVITILCISNGEKKITKIDWFLFISSIIAIPAWMLTKTPFLSELIVSVVNLIAYIPTMRKSWNKPLQEGLTVYTWSNVTQILSLFALRNYTLTTIMYPISCILANATTSVYLLVRRKKLHNVYFISGMKEENNNLSTK